MSARCRGLVLMSSEERKVKVNKCTLGNRHKWEHIKNVQLQTQTVRTVSISLKGLYKCKCGAKKYGFML